jgi:hypothetical protein
MESWGKVSPIRIESDALTRVFSNACPGIVSLLQKLILGSITSAPAANALSTSIGSDWRLWSGGGDSFCMVLQRALFSPVQDSCGDN